MQSEALQRRRNKEGIIREGSSIEAATVLLTTKLAHYCSAYYNPIIVLVVNPAVGPPIILDLNVTKHDHLVKLL